MTTTIPDDVLAKLRATHGDVRVFVESGQAFALVPPPEALIDRIFDIQLGVRMGLPATGAAQAYANAATISVVYPEQEERTRLFARYRHLAVMLGMYAYGMSNGPAEQEKKDEPSSTGEPPPTST